MDDEETTPHKDAPSATPREEGVEGPMVLVRRRRTRGKKRKVSKGGDQSSKAKSAKVGPTEAEGLPDSIPLAVQRAAAPLREMGHGVSAKRTQKILRTAAKKYQQRQALRLGQLKKSMKSASATVATKTGQEGDNPPTLPNVELPVVRAEDEGRRYVRYLLRKSSNFMVRMHRHINELLLQTRECRCPLDERPFKKIELEWAKFMGAGSDALHD